MTFSSLFLISLILVSWANFVCAYSVNKQFMDLFYSNALKNTNSNGNYNHNIILESMFRNKQILNPFRLKEAKIVEQTRPEEVERKKKIELENKIYRHYLASRFNGASFLADFHPNRY